jgi:DNA polymerase-3 subunit alpha
MSTGEESIGHGISYVNLHAHTSYSYLDSVVKQEEYIKKAKSYGMKSAGISDHGNIDGTLKFVEVCEKEGIQPVLGCELYVVSRYPSGEEKPNVKHLCAWVKSNRGFDALCKILTEAHKHMYYNRPLISIKDFFEMSEDMVIGTGCSSGLFSYDDWKDVIKMFQQRFGKDLYAEILPLDWAPQFEINKRVLSSGLPVIPVTDCHYLAADENKLQEVLLAIEKHQRWNDPKRWKFDVIGLYLRSPQELLQVFSTLKFPVNQSVLLKGFANTYEVAEKCSFKLEKMKPEIPQMPLIKGFSDEQEIEYLIALAGEGLCKYNKDSDPRYTDRMRYELESMIKQGFVRYFLVVWEIHQWAKANNVMCGIGRGSVGGSIVAHCLGLTMVDPIQYGLLFERFISPDRVDFPDVDMDFEDKKRHLVIEHLEEIYGKEHVAHVSTVAAMGAKSALRDVCRVFDVPLAEVNEVSKHIVIRSGGDAREDFTLEDSFRLFEVCKRFQQKYPQICQLAMKLEGLIKNPGIHAAGLVLTAKDLNTSGQAVLLKRKNFERTVNWDRFDIEKRGLMKFDVLGLTALTKLREAREQIKVNHGIDIDFESVPRDDQKVFQNFTRGDSIGVFQFTPGIRKAAEQIGIERFDQVSDLIALYRPGTLRTGWIDDYRERKKGRQKTPQQHPIIDDITKDTYGIFLYQEQVMRLLTDLAGISPKETDGARRTISKVKGLEEFRKYEDKFVKGCLNKRTLSEKEARTLFEHLKHWGSYGFNKAHSTEYGLIAYLEMWLKTYYPAEFFAASLSTENVDVERTELIRDARVHKLKISLPDINKSGDRWVAVGQDLLCPLTNIKGLGEKAVEHILGVRAEVGQFESLEHFASITNGQAVNKGKIKALLLSGAFENLGEKFDVDEEERGVLAESALAFKIDSNPFRPYLGLLEFLNTHIQISTLMELHKLPPKADVFVCGQMEEVKFTYPKDIEKALEQGRQLWGGVYGRLRDKTTFTTVNFSNDVYKRNKELLEQSEGRFFLFYGKKKEQDSVMAYELWTLDDLKKGMFDNLPVKIDASPSLIPQDYYDALATCAMCPLGERMTGTLKGRVPLAVGESSYMIVAEAPGYNEEVQGIPLVGKAGKELFNTFSSQGYNRKFFTLSNVLKCRPPENRTPKDKECEVCREFLEAEIALLQPKIILVLGATALDFFFPEEERGKVGIVDLNGTSMFSDSWHCFLTFCIHPASVLYHRENTVYLRKGVEEFLRLIVQFS